MFGFVFTHRLCSLLGSFSCFPGLLMTPFSHYNASNDCVWVQRWTVFMYFQNYLKEVTVPTRMLMMLFVRLAFGSLARLIICLHFSLSSFACCTVKLFVCFYVLSNPDGGIYEGAAVTECFNTFLSWSFLSLYLCCIWLNWYSNRCRA